jgi:ankyrin repeat protein
VEHINLIQLACLLGEEDIAIEILSFVKRVTEDIEARKLLYEFMGRIWGNGNTVLHLASFMGMSALVKILLELGAAKGKLNERKYKPVDCTNDDATLIAFETVEEFEGNQV